MLLSPVASVIRVKNYEEALATANDTEFGLSAGIATTSLFEAVLSYLGVGVQPPTPSWGNMVNENQTYFESAPWLVFFPSLCIGFLALAFNLIGDALRDILDPTLRGRH